LRAQVRCEQQRLGSPAEWIPCDASLQLPQVGNVYRENASLSMACARQFLGTRFDDVLARRALQHAVWAGRQQELHHPENGQVEWILDGCHNGHAAQRLAETLRTNYGTRPLPLVMAILKTKNPQEIITPLLPHISSVILTRTPHPKMREPSEYVSLFGSLPVQIATNVPAALQLARELPGPRLGTGSLYFVGAVIEKLKAEYQELAWFRQFSPDNNELK